MKKIALTGSIATGKSTVLNILKNLGFSTFSCDEVVKKFYEKPYIQKKIFKNLGEEILGEQRKIDKKKILEKMTKDPLFRKKLENIFHPLVKKALLDFIKKNEKKENIVFAEIPLLYEVGWENLFDEVWVVSCNENLQKKRLAEKGLGKWGEILLSLQIPLKEKEKKAHRVIYSDKSLEDLEKEIKEILKEY